MWKDKNKRREYNKRYYTEHKTTINNYYREYSISHKREISKQRHDKYLDLEHWRWEDVEGYDGFTKNVHVHHKREAIGYSVAQLKEHGQYYNCRADELLCCTNEEHKRIHNEIDKFFHRGHYKQTARRAH